MRGGECIVPFAVCSVHVDSTIGLIDTELAYSTKTSRYLFLLRQAGPSLPMYSPLAIDIALFMGCDGYEAGSPLKPFLHGVELLN
jgi:hypothetical protein